MATEIKSIVLSGNGTNCERETAHACRLAGSDVVQVVSIWDLAAGEVALDDFHLLCLPGGFTDGDDLGAAQAAANRFRYSRVASTEEPLVESLQRFVAQGKLVIGICNGFQLLVKLGLLPWPDFTPRVTLTFNENSRFEDRWVHLVVDPDSPCVFTKGLKEAYFPVRHGEGRLVMGEEETGEKIKAEHLVPLRYADPVTKKPTTKYPLNPNGSWDAAAALCDPSGHILGLMPHPEAYLDRTNHPHWTRDEVPREGLGLAIFRCAIEYLQKNAS